MKKFRYILPFLVLFLSAAFSPPRLRVLSQEELALWNGLNTYRKQLGLPPVPLSPALCRVAQVHVDDLNAHPPDGNCNIHSWSGKSGTKRCCYTDDHRNAECMWSKPAELAGYKEKGYEIAAWSTFSEPDWLNMWKTSEGHHEVMINRGMWKSMHWKAVGLAIQKPYAVMWFGLAPDEPMPAGP